MSRLIVNVHPVSRLLLQAETPRQSVADRRPASGMFAVITRQPGNGQPTIARHTHWFGLMKPHDVTHALDDDTDGHLRLRRTTKTYRSVNECPNANLDRVIISVTVVSAGGRPVLYRAGRTGGPPHLTHGLPPVSPPRNTIKYGLQTARRYRRKHHTAGKTIIAPLPHPPPADPDYPPPQPHAGTTREAQEVRHGWRGREKKLLMLMMTDGEADMWSTAVPVVFLLL
ncbi:hypothetical protein Bbelb_081980 [Branchiostoma belcheri]|nr:hypothetical protein Bbelb_081980 [Branchiostoma belcheri]